MGFDRFALAALVTGGIATAPSRARAQPAAAWAAQESPAPGPAHAIGGYSAGCVEGAEQLPLTGRGFRVVKPERKRVFGHPLLVAFVRELGAQVKRVGLGMLSVGDLGQARGGPAPTGHASHQTGLDVDVWYAPLKTGLSAPSMLDAAQKNPARAFNAKIKTIVALAAADVRVERVFVHPVLKRALCQWASKDRAWLRKVRPWWGHHDHFHARLACPADSPECTAQEPLADGDGCAALAWWFSAEAREERERERGAYQSKVGASPQLPARCQSLVEAAPEGHPDTP